MADVIERLTAAASLRLGLDKIEEVGIAGFTTFSNISQSVELSSTVPEIPLEDGSFASDHIINNAIPIKIQGVVADVFDRTNPILEGFTRIQAEVGNVTKYLPRRTSTQLTKVSAFANDIADVTRKVDQAVADGQQAIDFFGDRSGSQSLREQFYSIMKELHDSKQLVTIQGSYQLYENMRITSLVMDEDNQTEDITFSLTAQEVRFARVLLEDVSRFFRKPSPGNKGITDGVKDKGKQAGTEVERSLAFSIFGG